MKFPPMKKKSTGHDRDVMKLSDLELRNLDRSFFRHPGEPQIKGALEREMNRRGILRSN